MAVTNTPKSRRLEIKQAELPHVGLLGGSFDPVHRAHIDLAKAALKSLELDWVELLPAGQPWQRKPLGAAPEHRLNMLRLACADDPALRVNPIELQRVGATYTIDTLQALPNNARYTWIMGSDQLANFCTWHRWRDIVKLVRLAVAERPGTPVTPPDTLAHALSGKPLVKIPFTPQTITASEIRRALAKAEPTAAMLDARVLDYIHTHRLYQDTGQTPEPSSTL